MVCGHVLARKQRGAHQQEASTGGTHATSGEFSCVMFSHICTSVIFTCGLPRANTDKREHEQAATSMATAVHQVQQHLHICDVYMLSAMCAHKNRRASASCMQAWPLPYIMNSNICTCVMFACCLPCLHTGTPSISLHILNKRHVSMATAVHHEQQHLHFCDAYTWVATGARKHRRVSTCGTQAWPLQGSLGTPPAALAGACKPAGLPFLGTLRLRSCS
eukprot:490907-Pelagomonas_calceolata.AAC.2